MEARIVNQDPPATCSGDITAAIQESARALGLRTKRMVSRAYHDALFMARCVCMRMRVRVRVRVRININYYELVQFSCSSASPPSI